MEAGNILATGEQTRVTDGTGADLPDDIEQIYRAFREPLVRFAAGVLRDVSLAEDAVQALFARVVEQRQSGAWRDVADVKAWLYRATLNEALQLRRRAGLAARARAGWRPLSDSPGPDHDLLRAENIARVRNELERLPPQQRQVVFMKFAEGKTFAKIAETLGVPLGTVLTRMRLALDRLRKPLQE